MASRRKPDSKPKRNANNPLAQFGIFDMPDLSGLDDVNGDDSDDASEGDLEAELQALMSGKAPTKPVRKPKQNINAFEVEKMAAECLKDTPSDEEEDDADLEMDEDLLAELKNLSSEKTEHKNNSAVLQPKQVPISPPKSETSSVINVIQERLKSYKEAEAVSKSCGDSSKARRYGRAVKTLEGLLKSAKSGQTINEEDIPPAVVIPKPKPPAPPVEQSEPSVAPDASMPVPRRPAPTPPKVPSQPAPSQFPETLPSSENSSIHMELKTRRDQYKTAALNAKRAGDNATALKYVKISKKFDVVIEAEQSGQPVDLSNMPPPPPTYSGQTQMQTQVSNKQIISDRVETEQNQKASSLEMEAALAAANEPEEPTMFNAPPPPTSILDALQQRLAKYASTRDAAKEEGNNSKARRLNRIVQQYEEAIKHYKAGKPVAFDELPTPPGFAPIPAEGSSAVSPPKTMLIDSTTTTAKSIGAPKSPQPSSASPKGNQSAGPAATTTAAGAANQPLPSGTQRKLVRSNTSTVLEKQLNFLLERQKLFRQAAMESKKNGDIQQAKEYLRMSKGFDSMIDATRSGLPIDATSIPTPPQLETDYVIIDKSECFSEDGTESKGELFKSLERDLEHQIEVCTRNKDHFLRLGDVSSASKFEKLGLESKKDFAVLQHLWKSSEPLPRFHYETRLFSMVQCHTDLADNDLEVTVERGINLPGKPDDLDSYVKIELPLPPETPQYAKTHTIRDTNNPIFQEIFKFEINRKSRSLRRHIKRQLLKLEVWSKGCSCLCFSGFFRSDAILGTVSIKLLDLETKCSIHDSFDLMDGRKLCGGKLEVKVRIRDPFLAKQVEEVKERWLVIGS